MKVVKIYFAIIKIAWCDHDCKRRCYYLFILIHSMKAQGHEVIWNHENQDAKDKICYPGPNKTDVLRG